MDCELAARKVIEDICRAGKRECAKSKLESFSESLVSLTILLRRTFDRPPYSSLIFTPKRRSMEDVDIFLACGPNGMLRQKKRGSVTACISTLSVTIVLVISYSLTREVDIFARECVQNSSPATYLSYRNDVIFARLSAV